MPRMHRGAWEKRWGSITWSGGWSERISPQDPMLGSFVSRQEGTRVGGKGARRHPGDVVRGGNRPLNVCVCVCVCWDRWVCFICLCLCTVLMRITILVLPLYAVAWIRHKRQKASYLCLHVKDYLFHWMCPPIICLSLSALFNLFLVSAQWLPLTVSPSQM